MNNPKIICTVTNDLNADRRMIRICDALLAANYNVELVGATRAASQPLIAQNFKQTRFNLWFFEGKRLYIDYSLRLFFYLLRQKFDALYAVDLDTLGVCALVIQVKKVFFGRKNAPKLIFDAHELFTETPEVFNRKHIRKFWLAVEQYGVPKTDVRFTVSQSIADELFKRYHKKFELVRNAPPLAFPEKINTLTELQNRFNAHILVYVGHLNIGRGLETAVEAMQHLPNFKLWIIGDGVLMPTLKNLAAQFNVEDRIVFFGHKNPRDIPALLQQATFGLHISENMGRSYELSLANKFFDYIHAALPIIFTEFIEYRTINAQFNIGVMISETDVKQVADAIQNYKNDFSSWQKLVLNCEAARKVLNWENEKNVLIKSLKTIL